MHVDTGQFAALTAEVERLREELLDVGQAVVDMGGELARVRQDAVTVRMTEMLLGRRAGMPYTPPRPPRHLQVLDGGSS